ncbi:MAG: polysaccharide deacetylase family protein [Bacteroidales bacterium]|nr:polysaccharide deacetylase family protein [Bacteroidales bacterium]
MILVYCDHITERHRFIFDFIFGDILGAGCQLTQNREEYRSFIGPKISYNSDEIPGGLHFKPYPVLDEKGIVEQNIKVSKWNGLPVFFKVEGASALPFDPFALSFYLISRYEEYLPFEPDEHGRFQPELSIAYREEFLQIPLVDAIVHEMKNLLKAQFPGISLPGQPFRFVPSFDIDIAFAHSGKGWPRAAAAWLKLLLKVDFRQFKERIYTLAGKMADPYDNFQLHLDLAAKYGHPIMYFALLGDFGRYDRNITYRSKQFRELLLKLSLTAEMGLHPSYQSFIRPEIFKKEKLRLEEIVQKPVITSRFHFLRLKFPQTYRDLAAAGIREDFSMGYSSLNGFRASTCTPFYFYDLEREERSNLRIHPFIFMDSAMIDHLRITPEAAVEEIKDLINQVEIYGGEAIGIWHNYSLSEKDQYKGWREVLISILEYYQQTLK